MNNQTVQKSASPFAFDKYYNLCQSVKNLPVGKGFYFSNVKTAQVMLFHGGYESAGDLLINSRLEWVTMGVL